MNSLIYITGYENQDTGVKEFVIAATSPTPTHIKGDKIIIKGKEEIKECVVVGVITTLLIEENNHITLVYVRVIKPISFKDNLPGYTNN
jgi:hypothetical protein